MRRTCRRHGLPLMGGGDWNDGMNRVGKGGKGESVWLGWFTIFCLNRFAVLAEAWRRSERRPAAVESRGAERGHRGGRLGWGVVSPRLF